MRRGVRSVGSLTEIVPADDPSPRESCHGLLPGRKHPCSPPRAMRTTHDHHDPRTHRARSPPGKPQSRERLRANRQAAPAAAQTPRAAWIRSNSARASTRWAKVVRELTPPARNAPALSARSSNPGRAPTGPRAPDRDRSRLVRVAADQLAVHNSVSTASHTSATLTPSASAESSQPVTGSSSAWPEHERLTPWSERLMTEELADTPCTAVSA